MKKFIIIFLILIFTSVTVNAQEENKKEEIKIDYRIDNMGYWMHLAKLGLVPVEPFSIPPKATYKGSGIDANNVNTKDSPDIPVSDTGTDTQSENSIFVNPTDNSVVLNSNNSTSWDGSWSELIGTSYFSCADFGLTWTGSVQGVPGSLADPAAVIDLNGRHYLGYISDNGQQVVSYSTDGLNWESVLIGPPGWLLDKNHLWVDNSPQSPYCRNVYAAWANQQGGSNYGKIEFVYSDNGGLSYSSIQEISSGINTGWHLGANINTGPDGEMFVVWAVYDPWPLESSMGFAKSTDGGATFAPATKIIENIKGIGNSEYTKNHRINSMPSMTVDISGGMYNGNIYVVWTNVGVPGINTGTNRSVYMIKSTDGGTTWATPIRINQGLFEEGKEAYFPWITCDPVSGVLSAVFYDDRDVSSTEVETWVANSFDGGETWEDFRVSDVAFSPAPIPGFPQDYMGDYLGISARNGMVYPVWTDNRNGYAQTFVSPFETNTRANPADLEIVLNETTGQTDLTWYFTEVKTLQYFVIYRDNVQISTTTETNFTDMLPDYGKYYYSVTAMHEDGESSAATAVIQWGDPDISIDPGSLTETLFPNQLSTQILTVNNTGELDLIYKIAGQITTKGNNSKSYCYANAGGTEYISGVEFGSISNTGTEADGYTDYTDMSTDLDAGNTYPITVSNGDPGNAEIRLSVWIDWNQDEDFNDPGENPVCDLYSNGQGTFDITVPWNALCGQTGMRVRIGNYNLICGQPCGYTSWGEVEDYSVNVNNWLQIENTFGTVSPESSDDINVIFNSADLVPGDYSATITINSNGTDDPVVEVLVILHVEMSNSVFENETIELLVDIYPNPTSGILNIEMQSGYNQDIELNVFNAFGALLKQERFSVNKRSLIELNLENLSSGIYLLNIKGDKVNIKRKFVIQK